jgi:type IV secretory pathway protease TraF
MPSEPREPEATRPIMPTATNTRRIAANAAPEKFLKRIVGVPGDVLELKSDRLLINGKPSSEYLAALKVVDQLP